MLCRLPISLTTSCPNPGHTPNTVRNALREHNFCTVIKKKMPSAQKGPSFGVSQICSIPWEMGLWKIGRGSLWSDRPKSTGLGQCILGKRREKPLSDRTTHTVQGLPTTVPPSTANWNQETCPYHLARTGSDHRRVITHSPTCTCIVPQPHRGSPWDFQDTLVTLNLHLIMSWFPVWF